MIKTTKFLALFNLLVITQCVFSCQEPEEESKVITEGTLFVSTDKVKLSGRIFQLSNGVDDHGFQISNNSNFEPQTVVSIGSRNKLGKFIIEEDSLLPKTEYFFRAYIRKGDETVLGEVKSFKTSFPQINSIEPLIGYKGDIITISGTNIPKNIKVYFGDNEAVIIESLVESVLKVRVPQSGITPQTDIKFITNDSTVVFDHKFEFVSGIWNKLDNFVVPTAIYNCTSFISETAFYFGLGLEKGKVPLNNKMWKLDLDSWQWSEVIAPNPTFYSGFSSNLGIFGLGTYNWESGSLNNKLWKVENNEFVDMGVPPFNLYTPVSVSINNLLFVGGGYYNKSTANFNLYKLDISTNTWSIETQIPFHVTEIHSRFAFQDRIYFINSKSELWVYNMSDKSWSNISKYPITNKGDAICVVINDKAYIGLSKETSLIYEYDITNNSWKEKQRFSGDRLFANSSFFTHDNRIYSLRFNPNISSNLVTEIWEFDPLAF